MERLVRIGKIVKARGINGEVLIKFESGKTPANESEPVFLDFEGIQVPFFMQSVRAVIDSEWLVVFEDYACKTKAEKLLGHTVSVLHNNIGVCNPEPSENDLMGYEVIDEKHGLVGTLQHIQKGAQYLMIIEKDGVEIFIPFVEDFIVGIDEDLKRIVVATPDGLLDMNK